jgi:hypothetical protein
MNRSRFSPLAICLAVFVVFALHSASVLAQSPVLLTYTVPPQPLHLQVIGSEIHVLCGQVDNNFNGTQDVGDVPASWVVLNANGTNTLRSQLFAWNDGVGFPCRPAYDVATNTLYLAQRGRIRAFDTRTQAVKRDTVLLIDSLARSTFGTSGTISALSFARTGISAAQRLAISLRGRSTSAVIELDPVQNRILNRYPAGIFVQQAIFYTTPVDGQEIVILNEGGFGTSTATLMIGASPNTLTALNIGDTGNHLYLDGGRAFVTMNGSHQVHIVDLNTRRITRTIPTNTSGFNGPRESVLIGNTLYVTTYASDVRMFDIRTGQELGRLNPRGKPEGIAALGNNVVVANAFEAGGFASATSVVVFNTIASVKKIFGNEASISLSPNPTADRTTLRVQGVNGFSGDISLVLVNTLGKQVATLSPHFTSISSIETEFSAEELGLAQGMYFVHIRSAQGMTAVPVQVLR